MLYDWRDRIEAGTLLGPRMVVGEQIIDGDPTLWDPNLIQVLVVVATRPTRAGRRTAGEGRRRRLRQGLLAPQPRAAHRAIIDEARRNGLTVAGHGPDSMLDLEARQRRRAAQHRAHPLRSACRSPAARPRYGGWLLAINVEAGDYNGWFRQVHPIEWLAANTFSRARAAEVFGTLRAQPHPGHARR